MNAKRMVMVVGVLVLALALGVTVAAAQQGGGPGGGGQGNGFTNGGAVGGANGAFNPIGQMGGNGYQGGRNPDAQRGVNGGAGLFYATLPAVTDPLPQAVIDLMIAGWMDEQHAYAVYGAVIAQFGDIRPFTRIQRSEAQHSAAWEAMFTRYGVEIPAVPTFDLPTFTSPADACAIGADAEVANYGLYDAMIEAFQPYPDLLHVAQTLRDASEFNHLPAFQMCAG